MSLVGQFSSKCDGKQIRTLLNKKNVTLTAYKYLCQSEQMHKQSFIQIKSIAPNFRIIRLSWCEQSLTETDANFSRLTHCVPFLSHFIQTKLVPFCVPVIDCTENDLRGLYYCNIAAVFVLLLGIVMIFFLGGSFKIIQQRVRVALLSSVNSSSLHAVDRPVDMVGRIQGRGLSEAPYSMSCDLFKQKNQSCFLTVCLCRLASLLFCPPCQRFSKTSYSALAYGYIACTTKHLLLRSL